MDFKTHMNYRGLDFDGDKTKLYSEIRTRMGAIYEANDVDWGSREQNLAATRRSRINVRCRKQKIKKRYQGTYNLRIGNSRSRVQEKVKEIRQKFPRLSSIVHALEVEKLSSHTTILSNKFGEVVQTLKRYPLA